jgi:hypothetical protein
VAEREERIGRNEVLFREVNERVEEIQSGEGVARRFDFLCECADRDCVEAVSLSLAEYEDVRSESTQFVVVPGHEAPRVEFIVRVEDRFAVVRKQGEAAEFAERHDPRSA